MYFLGVLSSEEPLRWVWNTEKRKANLNPVHPLFLKAIKKDSKKTWMWNHSKSILTHNDYIWGHPNLDGSGLRYLSVTPLVVLIGSLSCHLNTGLDSDHLGWRKPAVSFGISTLSLERDSSISPKPQRIALIWLCVPAGEFHWSFIICCFNIGIMTLITDKVRYVCDHLVQLLCKRMIRTEKDVFKAGKSKAFIDSRDLS